jgi:hypothetical protein
MAISISKNVILMKRNLSGLVLFLFCVALNGQDKIITTKGSSIDAIVVEQARNVLKYKMADYPDGPVIWIGMNQVAELMYKNGYRDQLGNQNPRRARPFVISGGMSYFLSEEGGKFSLTAGYYVIPQIELEVNGGTDFDGSYLTAGARFHLNSSASENRFTPFSGFLIGTDYGFGIIQIPVGLNYAAKSGLNVSLSVNEMLYFNDWQTTFAELRLGWRFK